MAWPRKLNIAGKPYKVTYCKSMADVDPSGEEMLWGWHSSTRREIRVYSDCSEADLWDTLLHEADHAIIDERPALKAILGEGEEAFVGDHASAFVDFLLRNRLV